MGGTPKWMVHKGKSHLEMDDLGGTPIYGNPQIAFSMRKPGSKAEEFRGVDHEPEDQLHFAARTCWSFSADPSESGT